MTSPRRPVVRIGVVGPLTGPRAEYGELLLEAARLGAEAARAAHPAAPEPELVAADDAAMPAPAREAARRLLAAGVDAVVGHFNSDAAAEAGPLYREAGVPLLLPASTRDGLAREIGALRLCPTDADQVTALAEALAAVGAVALATDATPYAARLVAALVAHPALAETRTTIVSLAEPDLAATPEAEAIALLGTHPAILAALARWSEAGALGGRRLLACDDCSLPAFADELPPGITVSVAAPRPSFAEAVREAIGLVVRHAAAPTGLGPALAADPLFAEGERRDARFALVETAPART
ncbi:ABC transporter substrate-binding protein [Salinarimonas sp.]|uniref:ABC transporter substrate-binding protein n=1 Tax=Salinarimonas sp. TaxID=2766526 RepID=UPI0032D981C1